MSRGGDGREGHGVLAVAQVGDLILSVRSMRRSSGEWVHAVDVMLPGDENGFQPDPCLSVVLKSRSPVLRPRAPRLRLLPGGKA